MHLTCVRYLCVYLVCLCAHAVPWGVGVESTQTEMASTARTQQPDLSWRESRRNVKQGGKPLRKTEGGRASARVSSVCCVRVRVFAVCMSDTAELVTRLGCDLI